MDKRPIKYKNSMVNQSQKPILDPKIIALQTKLFLPQYKICKIKNLCFQIKMKLFKKALARKILRLRKITRVF